MRWRIIITASILIAAIGLNAQSFTQVQNNFASTSASSLSVTVTTTSGDFILVGEGNSAGQTNDSTPTDSASQTYTNINHATGGNANSEVSLYYVNNSAALTSVTCNWVSPSTQRPCFVFEISGVVASSPIDANVTGGSGSGTTTTSGSLTTTNAKDILVFAGRVGANQTTWTQGSGYTIPNNNVATGNSGSNIRMALQYKVVTTTQSGVTTNMTYGAGGSNENIFVAIKSASKSNVIPVVY